MWDTVMGWSEVWSLLIPIMVWLWHRRQPGYMLPIIVYLFLALILNALCDLMAWHSNQYFDPKVAQWSDSNTMVYNLHSLVRFFLFSWFFSGIGMFRLSWVRAVQAVFVLGWGLINVFSEETFWNPNSISGIQFTLEAFLLLMLCLAYYLKLLVASTPQIASLKSFWVVTGIAMYCVVNFFVFLYYNPLISTNISLALKIWRIHNLAFIVWCILIAIALQKQEESIIRSFSAK